MKLLAALALLAASVATASAAGPYSKGLNDPGNVYDAPVPGFVGPDGEGLARLSDGDGGYSSPRNYVNPLFFGWAVGWVNYLPSDTFSGGTWDDPTKALGPVTGDNFDVVSLGDLNAAKLNAGNAAPGQITLTFTRPITDKPGADFVVFENSVVASYSTGGTGAGGIFAELAYVEVSSDGTHFARFPSASLTPASVGSYGTIDPTNVGGLAGKHANAYGDCWGTPFDLGTLAGSPLVNGGLLDLRAVRYVRIVDIPGRGDFLDSQGRPIYDSWFTFGSGGFDLEAVGVISQETTFDEWETLNGLTGTQRGASADPDGDGVPNLSEYAFSLLPLTGDADGLPKPVLLADRVGVSFSRDTRKLDLTYEVEASSDLRTWQTIARGTAGGPVVGVTPYVPAISEASDGRIVSVGVIRRVVVGDVVGFSQAPRRFLRVRASLIP